jgi:hypothetical protein
MAGIEVQDYLPGMSDKDLHPGKNWCGPCQDWITGEPCDEEEYCEYGCLPGDHGVV